MKNGILPLALFLKLKQCFLLSTKPRSIVGLLYTGAERVQTNKSGNMDVVARHTFAYSARGMKNKQMVL